MSFGNLSTRAMEFGLTPAHVFATFQSRPPAALLNSIPKSGTNLLTRLLYLTYTYKRSFRKTIYEITENELPTLRKRGIFTPAHVPFSDSASSFLHQASSKHILIVRHPYDVAISTVNYILRPDSKHRLHNYFSNNLTNEHDRLNALFNGVSAKKLGLPSPLIKFEDHYSSFLGWTKSHQCLTVQYEHLVGSRGGGEDGKQKHEVQRVFSYLNLDLDPELVLSKIYSSKSRTFHQGAIFGYQGRKDSFDFDGHVSPEFKKAVSDLGYNMKVENGA